MIAVLQRVSQASVSVENQPIATIRSGLLILLGIAKGDADFDIQFITKKILELRIFPDTHGHMNQSILDIQGELLLVSQFTLLANTAKGRRPSFDLAAPPDEARLCYQTVRKALEASGLIVQTGRFGATMAVSLINDGPVTMILNSRTKENGQAKRELSR